MKRGETQVALLGCGRWGTNLARNLTNLGALYGVFDPIKEKAQGFAEKFNVRGYQTYESILDDQEIHAVIIATPPSTHFEVAKKSLKAGKDVFIEKPMATNSSDALSLVDLAMKNGRIIGTGHTTLYHPAFQELVSLIKSNELGTIKFIETRQYKNGIMKTKEDIVWDAMPHEASIALALLNEEPTEIRLITTQLFPPHPADIATLDLTFQSGVRAKLAASWVAPERQRWTHVIGEKQSALFEDTASEDKALSLFTHEYRKDEERVALIKGEKRSVRFSFSEPLANEMKDFLEAVRYRKEPLSNGLFGARIVKILETASLTRGGNRD